jgi:hypothetical protein
MNDLIPLLFTEAAETASQPARGELARRLVEVATALLPVQGMLIIGLAGLALLVAGFLDARTGRAAGLLSARPARSALLGGLALVLLLILTVIAAKAGPGRGGIFAGFLLLLATAAGLAATARAVGERLAPEAGSLGRLLAGLAACCLPLILPLGLGLPATAVAAALGFGAMLRARRSSQPAG